MKDNLPTGMAKRIFDIIFSLTAITLLSWLMVLVYLAASAATRSGGLFLQQRIGRFGKPFTIYKFRTINPENGMINMTSGFLRRSKMDELPQFFNVLFGDMSIVGPRPDISGYYDRLTGEDRRLLDLRPGITGPASLKYFDEEAILSRQADSLKYNDEVIFPDKVRINRIYQQRQSIALDVKIILYSVIGKKLWD
ncbi:MAG: sugar transferase [Flavobacterium sp.]|nr:MAG: sugar transferase [Flavobacterium sp.]